MVLIAIALMIVIALAIVVYPYFKSSRELDVAFADLSDPMLENLVVQRDATYSAIKDLEFDHAMSKLSDADYKSLRSKLETKAVSILQELDGVVGASKPPEQSKRTPVSDDEIERRIQQMRGGAKKVRCAKCGTLGAANDRFCAKCGAPMNR
jgi:LSD1 subclass zinc finger protein